jgi:hypothetical protein
LGGIERERLRFPNQGFSSEQAGIDEESSRPEHSQRGANCRALDGIVVRFAAIPDSEDLSSETATVN